MKILLDESIDVRFKKYFPDAHKVYTVQDMGWKGIKMVNIVVIYEAPTGTHLSIPNPKHLKIS